MSPDRTLRSIWSLAVTAPKRLQMPDIETAKGKSALLFANDDDIVITEY
jgi:hypothetical protein